MPSENASARTEAVTTPVVAPPAGNGRLPVSAGEALALALLLFGIHLTDRYSYLLFHSLAELFSVCIAVAIAIIAANCWRLIRNQYVLVLGAAYFFVGLLDVLHTLSYKSMPIFTDYDYYAPQFWIAARYLESSSMLAGFLFLGSRRRLRPAATIAAFSVVTAASIASILYFRNFPVCFVAGEGLTRFKILSEFAICGILLLAVLLLHRRRRLFDPAVYRLIQWSALLAIASELCFTLYTSDAMSDAFNEIGHLFKAARFFLIYKALVVTGLGDPLALLFRDLKRSEDSLLEAQQIAQLGSWEWDVESGRWNWTAEIFRLFDIGSDAAPELDLLLERLPARERRALRAALDRCVSDGLAFELLLTVSGYGGNQRFAQMRGRPLRDRQGKVNRLSGTILDITRQQRLMNALTEAKEAADAASVAKGAFLANMSHEIRTPLGAVLGFARIGARDSAEASSRLNFSRILEAGEHLIGVINGVLDYAKMEAGKFEVDMSPFQPAAVIANARSFVLELARQKGLACMVEGDEDLPEWLLGDALRLQQILVNLLANAVKFTASGYVRLKIFRSGEWTSFRVEDSGIGIRPQDLARLFRPFEQADNSVTRSYAGTGLGLAISQSLAALMGGAITAESSPGEGSAFTLRLPLAEATGAHASPQGAAGTLSGLRILAAEDVEVNRLILEDMLSFAGAGVVFAQNGEEAVERVAAQPDAFDVVLMDVQMPVMDGYEATRRIRQIATGVPVVGLTAHALAEERMKCFAAGMVEHVTKPVDPDALVAAIQRAVRPDPERAGEAAIAPAPSREAVSEIDWAALHQQMGARPGLIARLVRMALAAHADKGERIRVAAADARYEELAALAHTLRGVAGNLKARAVMELARRLEEAARQNRAEAAGFAASAADAADRMLAELKAHAEAAEAPGAAMDG
ncbi:MAG TPA: MASE3 domain-containing protein [Rhodocyclaceae bacterium]